ncbi:hypothetical protein [Streptomyces canus]|uniref:hypothetical protein n=1 Tax=Streptomyces canus TaxID=58343 RepID=UPI003817F3A2
MNVLGNAAATIVIGKWENDFDTERARKVLHSRTTTPPQGELGTAKVGAGKPCPSSSAVTPERRRCTPVSKPSVS